MKAYYSIIILVLCGTFAQAQISIPQQNSPKFDLNLNGRYGSFDGLNLELNLGMELQNNRSVYLGLGGNGRFNRYARLGMMQDVIVRDRFTLGVGVGLQFNHTDYTSFDLGKSDVLSFQIPIQAEYRITDRISVVGAFRTNVALYSREFGSSFRSSNFGFGTECQLGVKYQFGK